jgi:RNA polymerase sigma-70 factor (ECF subfamily)
MELLETLNDTQQEALRLKFQGGLSYKEIAAVMDITSNHVGVLIHHAIRALREHLAAQRPQPSHGIQTPNAGS